VQYGYGQATYEEEAFDLKRQNYGGQISQGLTRYLSLHLGYSQERADYTSTSMQPIRYGSLDGGLDYGRPLSLTRHTKFTFGITSLALDNGPQTYYTAGGHANLSHEFKAWNVNLAYNRGVGFIDGFADPYVADGVSAGLTGRVNRRTTMNFSAGYSNGNVGSSPSDFRNFSSYTGLAHAEFALMRRLGLFGEYVYYHYDFNRLIQLPLGTPHRLNRQGVRAGLMLTVPLLQERTPRVTR
jgi:hypothetical protein